VHRINTPEEVPDDLEGVVGVTAGASAPEELVCWVIDRLDPVNGIEEVRITEEEEYFPPPRNLRELLEALDVAATLVVGGTLEDRPTVVDRETEASEVLGALVVGRP
jgi:4-hydroxy-3-methylbut-2-enyl diphosphate reductase